MEQVRSGIDRTIRVWNVAQWSTEKNTWNIILWLDPSNASELLHLLPSLCQLRCHRLGLSLNLGSLLGGTRDHTRLATQKDLRSVLEKKARSQKFEKVIPSSEKSKRNQPGPLLPGEPLQLFVPGSTCSSPYLRWALPQRCLWSFAEWAARICKYLCPQLRVYTTGSTTLKDFVSFQRPKNH